MNAWSQTMAIALLSDSGGIKLDGMIRTHFDIPSHVGKKHFAVKRNSLMMLRQWDGRELLPLLEQLLLAFDARQANSKYFRDHRSKIGAGAENWTLRELSEVDKKMKWTSEVYFERQVVSCFPGLWFNMIPTASGTYAGNLGRVSIDLATRVDSSLHFFELKLTEAAGDPFYAAMELTAYALMWLQARNDADNKNLFKYRDSATNQLRAGLASDDIKWRVLAPKEYYQDWPNLVSFSNALSEALSILAIRRCPGVHFHFEYQEFDYLKWMPKREMVVEIINDRKTLVEAR
jgi:hypothetical protein